MTEAVVWKRCLERLEEELSSQQFNTWIRPLQAQQDVRCLRLFAPNRFVMDWVKERSRAARRTEDNGRGDPGEAASSNWGPTQPGLYL